MCRVKKKSSFSFLAILIFSHSHFTNFYFLAILILPMFIFYPNAIHILPILTFYPFAFLGHQSSCFYASTCTVVARAYQHVVYRFSRFDVGDECNNADIVCINIRPSSQCSNYGNSNSNVCHNSIIHTPLSHFANSSLGQNFSGKKQDGRQKKLDETTSGPEVRDVHNGEKTLEKYKMDDQNFQGLFFAFFW